jgi:hypothetical protein
MVTTKGVLALVVLVLLQSGCATGVPLGGRTSGSRYRHQRLTPSTPLDVKEREASSVEAMRSDVSSEEVRVAQGGADRRTDGDKGRGSQTGWRDGVGDGRPYAVPISLDYFQGFLTQAGVPSTAVPVDGRTLLPVQAMGLLPHLLSTPVTLGNFGMRRMAAHLLLGVATGGAPVSRDELHARMRRFTRLLVLRPDGYLVRPTTGVAVQKAGEVVLAEDGTLRAGRFEVGPFYAIEGGRLFPVDEGLEVPRGARPSGLYEPDDGVLLPAVEGAALAVVDTVEGLYRLVFHTGETLDGLAQLPGAVRELYENAPQLWEEFRHKPSAERVRTVSRLATGAVLMMGTSGAETFFRLLAECHPSYVRWYEQNNSTQKALQLEFEPTHETFLHFFGKKKYQLGPDGFSFGAWTGHVKQDQGGMVLLRCGSDAEVAPNRVQLFFPSEPVGSERMLAAPVLAGIMRAMAVAWEPDWAIATADGLWEQLSQQGRLGTFMGWMTYVSRQRGEVPALPEPARVETVDDKGSLIILTPERLTPSNPEHVALAHRIQQVLQEQGLLRLVVEQRSSPAS